MNLENMKLPWMTLLEENAEAIVEEWKNLPEDMMFEWMQADMKHMTAIMLYFHGGISPFADLCPVLMETVLAFPRLRSVTIQTMQPGGHLPPHKGATAGLLRAHLGLEVPEDKCWIEVEGKRSFFKTGETFLFDDWKVHEVMNESEVTRTNLIIDCWAPFSVPGQRVRRVAHMFAHKVGAKRSSIGEYFDATMEFATDYKAKHPELFPGHQAQMQG